MKFSTFRRSAVRVAACAALIASTPWSVAAAPDATRLVAKGALVHDTRTDLTWQRCTLGQRWDAAAGHCAGAPVRLTFDEAKQLERDGWRVPTLDELLSIVVTGRMPSIDERAFPDTPPLHYWATDNRDRASAWYVLFENGRSNHYFPPRTNRDHVRFVRTGPWQGDAGPQPPVARRRTP